MGHDTHFLRRLDRVADAHVELALTLYRDEALLEEVLARACLPESMERLAISLDDPAEGPFVIVTRAGRFVTCLAKGMRLSDDPIPVLGRERLDAAIAKVERARERVAEVARLKESGAEGVAGRLFARMRAEGLRFCREDAAVLLGVQPLVSAVCAEALLDNTNAAVASIDYLATRRIDRVEKLSRADHDLLERFSRAVYLVANLVPFVDHADARELFDRRPELGAGHTMWSLAVLAFDFGSLAHGMRSLWLVGRHARASLPFAVARRSFDQITATFRELALGMIALSSKKARAEAQKALGPGWSPEALAAEPANLEAHQARFTDAAAAVVRACLDDVEPLVVDHHEAGRFLLAAMEHGVEPTPEQIAAVPTEAACAALSSSPFSWMHASRPELLLRVATALPWLSRASAEQLFLPRRWAALVAPPAPEMGAKLLEGWARVRRARIETQRSDGPKVGRNDPCPCGSGKKYKRCCAE